MDLMVIATGLQLIKLITFVVSKLFMLLSLSYNDFVKVTSQIAYVYFISLSSLRVCSQASNKFNGDLLATDPKNRDLYAFNNSNSVF